MLNESEAKSVAPQFSQDFIQKLIWLFSSPDPRERDYLKTLMHRLYSKCINLRSFIRQSIVIALIDESSEVEKAYGKSEFLEILISIINGYNFPLKQDNL